MNLDTPKARRDALEALTTSSAPAHHDWLRQCFDAELVYRLSGEDDNEFDYFENIYHCALFLHVIGDLADLPRLYHAKLGCRDFDLGCGFDWQFLFLDRPEVLRAFAHRLRREDIVAWIDEYTEMWLDEDMEEWLEGTMSYHGVSR